MTTGEIVTAAVVGVLAGGLWGLAVLHSLNCGPLLNNAWLYASAQTRRDMDKKPYYRQSAVVFCLLSAVMAIIGLSVVLHDSRLTLLEAPLLLAAILYAIVSSVRLGRGR